jgi:hypothetical protein
MSNIIDPVVLFFLSLSPQVQGMLFFGLWMIVALLIAVTLFGDWECWR